jgi:hypothetical protein
MVLGAPALAEGSVEGCGCDVKWIPHHRFEIQSSLSSAAALDALRPHVEARRMFRVALLPSSANDKRFQGVVGADSFEITRIIGYRNSFLPQVSGAVRPSGSRSVIDVEMKLFAPVIILVLAIAALLLLVVGAAAASGDAIGLLSLLLLPVLAYGGVLWGFWFEAEKQERALREIFRAA